MTWPTNTRGNPLPCARCGKTGLELNGASSTCPSLPEQPCVPPEPEAKPPECPHHQLDFHIDDNYFEDRPGLHAVHLKASCSVCKLPFHFVNAPSGVVFTGGVATPDGMELQMAMAPGEHPSPRYAERRTIPRQVVDAVEKANGEVVQLITKDGGGGNLPN